MLYQTILTSLIIAFPLIASGDMNYTPLPQTVETKIEIAFKEDAELMKKIAKCESGMRQFDSEGNTITSPTKDFGLFQINEKSWEKVANEMELDYKNNVNDNITLAKYIFDKSGKSAWVCSRKII